MPADPPAAPESGHFELKDCALIAIATGKRVLTVRELRDTLAVIRPDSVYYHFWGSLLQPRFDEREYNNHFAAWAWRGLHDAPLAERLAVVDPTEFEGLEALREELLEVIEQRIDESEALHWARAKEPFEFIRSQIVVFDTRKRLRHPEELAEVTPTIAPSSIFYHFIDARRRLHSSSDDFREWLNDFGGRYADLASRLAEVDPYFGTLTELRQQLADLFQGYFAGGSR